MSQGALCKAVRAKLQRVFNLTADSCEVCFDGQPGSAVAGEFYIAVHPLGWNGISGDHDLHEEFVLGVTLTMRTAFAPRDRLGIAVWLDSQDSTGPDGLEECCRKTIAALHKDQLVRKAASLLVDPFNPNVFVTPLWFGNTGPPIVRNWDWFGAEMPEGNADPVCGVSQTLTFGKCQRCQPVVPDEMD